MLCIMSRQRIAFVFAISFALSMAITAYAQCLSVGAQLVSLKAQHSPDKNHTDHTDGAVHCPDVFLTSSGQKLGLEQERIRVPSSTFSNGSLSEFNAFPPISRFVYHSSPPLSRCTDINCLTAVYRL